MMKFVAFSCVLAAAATTANAMPAAEADPGYGTVTGTVRGHKCEVEYEEIETQSCVPKKENICEEKEVEQETLSFEKQCKEVTSKDCKPERVIYKRDAEAEAYYGAGIYGGLGYGGYGGLGYGRGYAAHAAPLRAAPVPHGAPAHAPLAPAAPKVPTVSDHVATVADNEEGVVGAPENPKTVVTIKSDCREVTKEVCVNTPKKESKKVPVQNCHVKQTVDCKMIKKRIPKKNCEVTEEKVITPHVPSAAAVPGVAAAPAPAAAPQAAGYAAPAASGYAGFGGYGRPYWG